ncbi:MAG: choice-of-anchor tandem repeat GloVer-containing protein [Candidatus Baltobacteraceae bacterium]
MSVAPEIALPQTVAGGSAPELVEPRFARRPLASNGYKTLYTFKAGGDGTFPLANLIALDGTFFGTTSIGGASNEGTIFKVNASGQEAVVYSFKGLHKDGSYPEYGLIAAKNVLYGTTPSGGSGQCSYTSSYGSQLVGCGIVFKVTTSGHEDVLYNFEAGSDGAEPVESLVALNGTLYGITVSGGTGNCSGVSGFSGCGAVFSVSTSGTERVLYSFKGGADGAFPSGLIALNGVFYGTTASGGGSGCYQYGCGTVFKMSTSGKEDVLYRFKGRPDGSSPNGNLVVLGGSFYGSTYDGGAKNRGSVFKASMTGQERLLYSFKGGNDGANPASGLTDVNGMLYGTTQFGAGSGCYHGFGCGSIFKITTSGTETVLHSFASGEPLAGLTSFDGTLYGTTQAGGPLGRGSVFHISP